MSSFAKISIRMLADLTQFSSQMQNANRSMQKMGQNFTKIGQGMSLGITLPILGIGAAAVKAASDAEETSAKFETVFRDVSKAAQESADILRNAYGLSSNASKQLLSDTGDLLTGFGFSQKSALDLSTEVNKLAVDLASFTNYSGGAEGASQALTKALLGERESVKSLGISILESDVKARVLLNSQQGLTFETERQAKAYATLQIAQEQSKNAIGDYARTSDGFANQTRLLQGRLNDLAVEFGEILLPTVTKLAGYVGKLIEKFSNLSPATKKIIVVIASLLAVVGPLLIALGFMMTTVVPGLIAAYTALSTVALPATIAAFKSLTTAMLANPIGLIVAAVASLVYGFTSLVQQLTPAVSKLQTFFNLVKSGGSYSQFVALQMESQTSALIAQQSAADAAAKSQAAFNKSQQEAVKVGKTLNATLDASPGGNSGSGSRKQISGLASMTTLPVIQQGPLDLIVENMPAQVEAMNEQQLIALDNANQFNEGMSYAISNAAANFAAGFAQMIGSATSGGISLQGIGRLILGTIADMAIQVGQMAIGIGIAVIGIKKALQSLAGPVAIAAGIALVALGALAKSALSNVASGGGSGRTAFANGGIVYGPTNALIGEYAGAKNNPEVIAPLNKLKGMLADVVGGGSNNLSGEFTVRGKDLIYVLGQADQYYKRRG